jgi:hypothetical protein
MRKIIINILKKNLFLFNQSYTWLCLLGVAIPYLIFLGPILYEEVSPVVPILIAVIFFFTLFCFILTGFTDPGIIPKDYILRKINPNSPYLY